MNIVSTSILFIAFTPLVLAKVIPNDIDQLIEEGNHFMQLSRDSQSTSYYKQATSNFQKALEMDPRNPEAMIGLAWVKNAEHDFDTGKKWANKAIAIDPKRSEAYLLLGDASLELGKYEIAGEQYQKALNLKPNLASYSRAAHYAWETGLLDLGKDLMLRAIKAGSHYGENSAWCKAQLALMYLNEGKLDDAELFATSALESFRDNPLVLSVAGKVAGTLRKTDDAINYFEKSVSISPTHEALTGLFDIYSTIGHHQKADSVYNQLIVYHLEHDHGSSFHHHRHGNHTHSHDPDPQDFVSAQMALFWSERNINLDIALKQARKAWRQYPNITSGEALAWSQYKNGNIEKAENAILRVMEFGTQEPRILQRAGIILKANGKENEAEKFFLSARRIDPLVSTRNYNNQ